MMLEVIPTRPEATRPQDQDKLVPTKTRGTTFDWLKNSLRCISNLPNLSVIKLDLSTWLINKSGWMEV